MNDDVRAEFRQARGIRSARAVHCDRRIDARTSRTGAFLEFRAELARRQQAEWIGQIESIRHTKPHLDLTLTHVDDRFDTTMREKIGADASRVLPMLGAARLHVSDRRSGDDLESGSAALSANRGALQRPHPRTGEAGDRYQCCRALSGRLSHQTTDRHRAVRTGPFGGGGIPTRSAVLREFDLARGLAPARPRRLNCGASGTNRH